LIIHIFSGLAASPWASATTRTFPVASIILPADARAVTWIYRFAREADDIADEGDARRTNASRPGRTPCRTRSHRQGRVATPRPVSGRGRCHPAHDLPVQLFRDLLDAFTRTSPGPATPASRTCWTTAGARQIRSDGSSSISTATPRRAASRGLTGSARACNSSISCRTSPSISQGRIYLPQDEMARFGIDEAPHFSRDASDPWRAFMQFQIDRARAMLLQGAPLGRRLRGRFGLECA